MPRNVRGTLVPRNMGGTPMPRDVRGMLIPRNMGGTPMPRKRIESIRRALVLGLRDYARKCGFKSVVLGLSGGN